MLILPIEITGLEIQDEIKIDIELIDNPQRANKTIQVIGLLLDMI